jgi:flap endonuclease-1
MGVRNLNNLIKYMARDSIRNVNLSLLSGKTLAIDLQLFLYKFQIQEKNAVKEIYKQIIHLKKFGINICYVLDGKPPAEKMTELYRRSKLKLKSKEILECLKKTEDSIDSQTIKDKIVELKKNSITISNELKNEIRLLCKCMDIQIIENTNLEADKTIGILYKNGVIDGVISEDNDMLVYGCGYLYRFYRVNSDVVVEYSLPNILEKLGVTYEQFVDICILSGCDYYKNIKYNVDCCSSFVGYLLIKKYGSLDNMTSILPLNLDYSRIRQIYMALD